MHPTKPRNRTQIAHTAVCLGAMLAASIAFAGPPPTNAFVKDLRIVDVGSSLSASASVFGLNRKRDAYVSMQATAKLDVACINPGGKKVPGQTPNDVETDVTGYACYPRFAIKLGRLDIDVETDRVGSQLPGAPDCPTPNWTERVERVRFVSGQVLVRQGNKIEVELLCRRSTDVLRCRRCCASSVTSSVASRGGMKISWPEDIALVLAQVGHGPRPPPRPHQPLPGQLELDFAA